MIDKVYIVVLYDRHSNYLGEERRDNYGAAEVLAERHGDESHIDTLGECECGDTVLLDSDINDCPNCGALFNAWGQELRRPSGEGYTNYEIETGLDN